MKVLFRLFVLCFILFSVNVLHSQDLHFSYHFSKPSFIERHDDFVEPIMQGCLNLGAEGYPLLPAYSIQVLLPQNTEIENIEITSISYFEKIRGVTIVPAPAIFLYHNQRQRITNPKQIRIFTNRIWLSQIRSSPISQRNILQASPSVC